MGLIAPDPLMTMVARMPLVEKLADGRKLHPAAVRKIISNIEARISRLTDEKYRKRLAADARTTADNVVKAARAAIAKLRAAIKSQPTTRPSAAAS